MVCPVNAPVRFSVARRRLALAVAALPFATLLSEPARRAAPNHPPSKQGMGHGNFGGPPGSAVVVSLSFDACSIGSGTTGDRSPDSEQPALGKVADRYRLLGKIGSGGMGAVYRALDESSRSGEPPPAVRQKLAELVQRASPKNRDEPPQSFPKTSFTEVSLPAGEAATRIEAIEARLIWEPHTRRRSTVCTDRKCPSLGEFAMRRRHRPPCSVGYVRTNSACRTMPSSVTSPTWALTESRARRVSVSLKPIFRRA